MSAPPVDRLDRRAACYVLVSLLLRYPETPLLVEREAVVATAAEITDRTQRAAVGRFLAYWTASSPAELRRDYVATFDLQKGCGLYLSHYLYGDRRQRGMTFLRLKSLYEAAGWELTSRELPDYLPLMLEFAARAPAGYGDLVLGEFRAALELLRQGLRAYKSPYAYLLDAVVDGLPGLTRAEQDAVRRLAAEGPPDEQVGLEPFAPPEVMPSAAGTLAPPVARGWPGRTMHPARVASTPPEEGARR